MIGRRALYPPDAVQVNSLRFALDHNRINQFTFEFDKELPVFEGHFPGYPLLPAIFQIEMAVILAERARGRRYSVGRIKKAKFIRMVAPGEPVTVQETLSEEGEAVTVKAVVRAGGDLSAKIVMELV